MYVCGVIPLISEYLLSIAVCLRQNQSFVNLVVNVCFGILCVVIACSFIKISDKQFERLLTSKSPNTLELLLSTNYIIIFALIMISLTPRKLSWSKIQIKKSC